MTETLHVCLPILPFAAAAAFSDVVMTPVFRDTGKVDRLSLAY